MAWQIDPYHLQVEFAVKHFGMMTVRGHFGEVTASGQIDPQNPAASSVEVTIKTDSIKTNNPQRDLDLRSSNFLGIEEFPTITFKSTKIEPAGDDEYKMTGDLTIKGSTRPVTLKVKRYGEINDERMGHRVLALIQPHEFQGGYAEVGDNPYRLLFHQAHLEIHSLFAALHSNRPRDAKIHPLAGGVRARDLDRS